MLQTRTTAVASSSGASRPTELSARSREPQRLPVFKSLSEVGSEARIACLAPCATDCRFLLSRRHNCTRLSATRFSRSKGGGCHPRTFATSRNGWLSHLHPDDRRV